MKYRIKKMEYKNGEIEYIPQYKFFMWSNCSQYNCTTGDSYPVIFDTFNQAKNYLYNYSNKVINTTYLDIDC